MNESGAKSKGFPVYPDLKAAVCFSCRGALDAPRDDGMPVGEGKYVGRCRVCRLYTWFDVDAGIETAGVVEADSPGERASLDGRSADQAPGPGRFSIVIHDNYHYMDPDEDYEVGRRFETADDALDYARGVIEASVRECYEPGMTAAALWAQYRDFGESPQIFGDPPVEFSAWDYARTVCATLCAESSE